MSMNVNCNVKILSHSNRTKCLEFSANEATKSTSDVKV